MAKSVPLAKAPEEIKRFAEIVAQVAGRAIKEIVAHTLFEEIVLRSPVGHPSKDRHPGKYRASHTVSIGEPNLTSQPDAPSYGVPGADVVDAALSRWDGAQTLYIANAAASDRSPESSYAGALEDGWSKQAPSGVYGPAIVETEAAADEIMERAVSRAEELLRAQAPEFAA